MREREYAKERYESKKSGKAHVRNICLRFVGTNLNYRRGQLYEAEVVQADIEMGIAAAEDFEPETRQQ